MIKKFVILLLLSLTILVATAYADVRYEVTFVPGATPTDVLGRTYKYEKGTEIEYQGLHEVPIKYTLHTITPVSGKENTHILRFLNDNEPSYLRRILETSKYILKVKLLK